MTVSTYDQEVRKLAANIAELCILKHKSYGTGNLINTPFKPRTVIAVRLYEKVARMANLIETGHEPEQETYIDTLKDIIGYTMAALMIENGTFELEMESQEQVSDLVVTDKEAKKAPVKSAEILHCPQLVANKPCSFQTDNKFILEMHMDETHA